HALRDCERAPLPTLQETTGLLLLPAAHVRRHHVLHVDNIDLASVGRDHVAGLLVGLASAEMLRLDRHVGGTVGRHAGHRGAATARRRHLRGVAAAEVAGDDAVRVYGHAAHLAYAVDHERVADLLHVLLGAHVLPHVA